MEKDITVCIVGCGTMGSLLAQRTLELKNITRIVIIDKNKEKVTPFLCDKRVQHITHLHELSEMKFDYCFIAIKPQDFNESLLPKSETYISIMAGVSTQHIIEKTQQKAVIRAMPNTPTRINQGVIGIYATTSCSESSVSWAHTFFSEMGYVVNLNSDDDINKLTIISANGPAYVFQTMESIYKAAHDILPLHDLHTIITQTFKGSLELVKNDTSFHALIQNVMSKGGTTEAALGVINKDLDTLWQQGLEAGYSRAKELSGDNPPHKG